MKDLITALQIFDKYYSKYQHTGGPTWCEHDTLHVCVDPEEVSDEDKITLKALGFIPDEWDGFLSFRYGSC